ncbi:threonine ammonia-lyase [Streptomyces qinzhouensis]|uniref:threonine ammonia-lyase n=1 Tax=Streptomyces qinzhouensis TaxID=2599401 RepID=A0A5B8JKV0_9ACTN|nr:threonine/serine dehydratase [Streptomyces qinzhouensis]QDY78153.1 threonine/serine dehydratase [Streptomyces qinzhouensis]
MALLTSHDVLAAADRIHHLVVRTPLLTSALVDERLGREVVVKAENMQLTGSFKVRGAFNAVAMLAPGPRGAGIVGASSGNHAQALALAGRHFGAPVTVVIPADAPETKVQGIKALGARIVTYDRTTGRRDEIVHDLSQRYGLSVVPSADSHPVIAGAGTAAWEMLRERPDLAAILVAVGGGGLAAGTALAAADRETTIRVYGVEPEAAADTHRSLLVGHRVEIPVPSTIADGLGHRTPGALTFEINRRLLAGVVTVPEELIADAMAFLWRHYRTTAEPSGAVAFAGLLHAAHRLPPGPIGVILSGGNVDWPRYQTLLDTTANREDHHPHAAALLR